MGAAACRCRWLERWWRGKPVELLPVDASPGSGFVVVPYGAVPGVTRLAIDVGSERTAMLTLPLQARFGDTIKLTLEDKGGWRCDIVRAAQQLPPAKCVRGFVPGDAVPGFSEVPVDTLDGQVVRIPVPKAAQPGDLLLLTRERANGDWSIDVSRPTWDVTAPLPLTQVEDSLRHKALFKAVASEGGFWSRKLARASAPQLKIPGIVSVDTIKAGEELACTPAALLFTPAAVRQVAPRLAQAVGALASEMPRKQLEMVPQVAYLTQLLAAAEEDRSPLSRKGGKASPDAGTAVWGAFARLLRSETLADHPYRQAIKDPIAFRRLMDPSAEAELVERLAFSVMARYDVIVHGVSRRVLGSGFTAERFLRAWLLVTTRAFAAEADGGNVGRTTLVPGMDSFNHRPAKAQAYARWDGARSAMVVEALRDIPLGEEVCISYGELCNPMLFRTYGFTLAAKEEPGGEAIILPTSCHSLLRTFLPPANAGKAIQLDSRHLHPSLETAIKACRAMNAGTNCTEQLFLEQLLRHAREPYLRDAALRPILEAWASEGCTPSLLAWGHSERFFLPADASSLAVSALRVKMSEYLCIEAHLIALASCCGSAHGSQDVGGTPTLREGLLAALRGR